MRDINIGQKKELRKKFIIQRRQTSIDEIEKSSQLIVDKLSKLDEFKKAKKVHIYMAFNNEVITQEVFKRYPEKQYFVPEIKSGIHEIRTEEIRFDKLKGDFIVVNSFLKPPKDIDLFVAPGLCFGLDGYRIGYGGGYYDYLLKNKKATKVGLCFDFQIVDSIPYYENDVPVDIIVSEKRVIEQKNRTISA